MTNRQSEIEARLGMGGHRRHWGRWLVGLLIAALASGGGWWWYSGQSGGGVSYRTQPVIRGALTVTVTATGTIEPLNVVEVSSELSGTLTAVHVDFNDRIEAGEVLAELDTTKLAAQLEVQRAAQAAASAQLASAKATLGEARDSFATTESLFQRGVATQSALDAAKAALERAEAAQAVATANLNLAQANFQAQQAELEKACICSPIDGVVLDVSAETGQIVAASLSAPVLFTIAEDLSKMELQVDVAEADIGLIAEGNPASFAVEAYDDLTFPAEITQVRYASQTIEGLVTYKAILAVENPELLLRPGMTAVAEIEVAHVEDALLVPNTALRYVQASPAAASDEDGGGGLFGILMPRGSGGGPAGSASGKSLWVLRDGAPAEVAVEPGESDGSNTVILGGDLAEGDQVIVARVTK